MRAVRTTIAHDCDISDVVHLCPMVAIEQVRIEPLRDRCRLECAICPPIDLPLAEHVGLTHHDEDLHFARDCWRWRRRCQRCRWWSWRRRCGGSRGSGWKWINATGNTTLRLARVDHCHVRLHPTRPVVTPKPELAT